MKSKQLLAGLFVFGSILTINAQNQVSTNYLTSGGVDAGFGGLSSAYYGFQAGYNTTREAEGNSFFGHEAGATNYKGAYNTFGGYRAGYNNRDGERNVFIGSQSAPSNENGSLNVVIGNLAADKMVNGGGNVYIGANSGSGGPSTPKNNTYVGASSGESSNGSGNVFLGSRAGAGYQGSSKLFISNTNDATPLIWGDFKADLVKLNGKVGTGGLVNFPTMAGTVDVSKYSIYALGGILTEELRITPNQAWADYVFEKDYNLLSLDEVESFIKEHGHLPNVPSAEEIKRDGMDVAEIAKIQQEKIEELTLHLIEERKQNKKQDEEIKELKALVQQLAAKK